MRQDLQAIGEARMQVKPVPVTGWRQDLEALCAWPAAHDHVAAAAAGTRGYPIGPAGYPLGPAGPNDCAMPICV